MVRVGKRLEAAGLLCSGVAVTMVIVVGIAMLLRRGWRIALLHTAPLGAAYLLWWATSARDAYTTSGSFVFFAASCCSVFPVPAGGRMCLTRPGRKPGG